MQKKGTAKKPCLLLRISACLFMHTFFVAVRCNPCGRPRLLNSHHFSFCSPVSVPKPQPSLLMGSVFLRKTVNLGLTEGWKLPVLHRIPVCATTFLITVGVDDHIDPYSSVLCSFPFMQTTSANLCRERICPFRPSEPLPCSHITICVPIIFISPAFLMPHGVPPGHLREIAAKKTDSYVPHKPFSVNEVPPPMLRYRNA